jgi:hypothetical protein
MRPTLITLILLGFAQVYKPDTLGISFYSDAPLEKISAESRKGSYSVIHFGPDTVYVRIPIQSFVFPNKLMQAHFNEDYLESDRYPYAYFRGKLIAPIPLDTPGEYAVSAEGDLTIHGKTQRRPLSGIFQVLPDKRVILRGKFLVRPADHGIQIPQMLWQKIAEEVEVRFYGQYRLETQP